MANAYACDSIHNTRDPKPQPYSVYHEGYQDAEAERRARPARAAAGAHAHAPRARRAAPLARPPPHAPPPPPSPAARAAAGIAAGGRGRPGTRAPSQSPPRRARRARPPAAETREACRRLRQRKGGRVWARQGPIRAPRRHAALNTSHTTHPPAKSIAPPRRPRRASRRRPRPRRPASAPL